MEPTHTSQLHSVLQFAVTSCPSGLSNTFTQHACSSMQSLTLFTFALSVVHVFVCLCMCVQLARQANNQRDRKTNMVDCLFMGYNAWKVGAIQSHPIGSGTILLDMAHMLFFVCLSVNGQTHAQQSPVEQSSSGVIGCCRG